MTQFLVLPHLLGTYGYFGIFIIVFLESGIFFPLPGDSLLFTAGLFAVALGFKLYFLIPIIIAATFLGGVMGYEIGANLIKLQHFSFFKKLLKKEHIDKTHAFLEKHGKMAVVFSRFVPIVRTFMPIVAGVGRMDYAVFMQYGILSSVLWSSILTLAGYFLGHVFPQIKDYLWVIIIVVVLVSVIPIILEIIKERRKR